MDRQQLDYPVPVQVPAVSRGSNSGMANNNEQAVVPRRLFLSEGDGGDDDDDGCGRHKVRVFQVRRRLPCMDADRYG